MWEKELKDNKGKKIKNIIFLLLNRKKCISFAEIFLFIMFAIVTIAGQQFKVKQNDELFVHRLEGNAGDKVEFSDILMVSTDGNITVGNNSKKVQAEIMDHLKGDKVIVFKKRRRKGYQKKNGHRQSLTRIKINEIA